MTTDRLVRARAEAERRYPGGQRRFTEANLQAAFRQGWLAADENHPAVEALARVRGLHRKFGLAGYGIWPSLPEHVFIKDYSEGSGITESLVKAGVVRIVGSLLVGPFQSRVYEVEVITGNDEEEGA